MEIELDPAKDAENHRKHGLSLRFAEAVLAAVVGDELDSRLDYGEERVRAFGLVEDRLFAVVYTLRRGVYRIIPVRPASRQEDKKWVKRSG